MSVELSLSVSYHFAPSCLYLWTLETCFFVVWLVVWNMNVIFIFSWEFHHPNWRTPSFFRGVGLNHQPVVFWITALPRIAMGMASILGSPPPIAVAMTTFSGGNPMKSHMGMDQDLWKTIFWQGINGDNTSIYQDLPGFTRIYQDLPSSAV